MIGKACSIMRTKNPTKKPAHPLETKSECVDKRDIGGNRRLA